MVFRAETPVQDIVADTAFAEAVGASEYNIYAQGVAQNSYLDLQAIELLIEALKQETGMQHSHCFHKIKLEALMAQNKNERDLRYKKVKWCDYTETHNNKFGGKNNKRNTSHYEPNKLFNVLAGGALLSVLTIGGFNTLANIVKDGIDAKNNIEE